MPRKGENIYKRKDGRWEARYISCRTPEGKAVYKSIYGKTYSDVKQKQALARTAKLPAPPRSSPKFEEIAASWLINAQVRVKESTYSKYRRIILVNLAVLLNISLEKITTQVIESFINTLLLQGRQDGQGGLAPKTVHDILIILRCIFNYAKQHGNQIYCDLSLIKITPPKQKIKILSKSDQTRLNRFLFQNMTYKNLGIALCLYTGIRIGELCALKWQNINLEEGILKINQILQRIQTPAPKPSPKTKIIISEPKSKTSIREIPLPDFLIDILKPLQQSPTAFILTGSQYHFLEPRTMQYYFSRILKSCNINPINFHALRHTFATRSIELGFELKSLSEILGHSSVNITLEKYVHSSFELKKENMKKTSLLIM